ncbi:hypothetical protein L810_0256 [Burkholderia sp. AU4i]|nr:hypothetical protein L810_0256 [Burkholderia sp. AU4i]
MEAVAGARCAGSQRARQSGFPLASSVGGRDGTERAAESDKAARR